MWNDTVVAALAIYQSLLNIIKVSVDINPGTYLKSYINTGSNIHQVAKGIPDGITPKDGVRLVGMSLVNLGRAAIFEGGRRKVKVDCRPDFRLNIR